MVVLFHRLREQSRGVLTTMLVFGLALGLPTLLGIMATYQGSPSDIPLVIQWGALGYYTLGFAGATFLMTTYNGKRGPSLKWFFYAYYPTHLMALWVIAQALSV